jgi:hypothetical protein
MAHRVNVAQRELVKAPRSVFEWQATCAECGALGEWVKTRAEALAVAEAHRDASRAEDQPER